MARSFAFDLETDGRGRESAGRDGRPESGWSARRKLLCALLLSVVSWLAILTPAFLLG